MSFKDIKISIRVKSWQKRNQLKFYLKLDSDERNHPKEAQWKE